jgi:hypothetical protein
MRVNSTEVYELTEAQSALLKEVEARAFALEGKLRVLRDASVEVEDEWAGAALESLSAQLRSALPHELLHHVEARSGMAWSVFIGHCIHWWEAQKSQGPRAGLHEMRGSSLLMTIMERLASLDLLIEGVYWNRSRSFPIQYSEPAWWPIILGCCLGIILSRGSWWAPWPFMAVFGSGLGWLFRGILSRQEYCGGIYCGAQVFTQLTHCDRCGGGLIR